MTITVIMNVPHVIVNFFPLQQGGTPQEFRVNRRDGTNFSVFVELPNVGNAYMKHDESHSSGKRGVYMDTRVVESQSYTIWPIKVPF